MPIDPTREQIKRFADAGPEGPVRMLNLLQFRVQADYPADSGHEPCSGAHAYKRYSAAVAPILEKIGAQVETAGACHPALIGDARDDYDQMIIVRYPSREAMLGMLASDQYKQITVHRGAAVAHSLLIPMTE